MSLLDRLKSIASPGSGGSPDPAVVTTGQEPADDTAASRRLREVGTAETEIGDAVAAKVLHGWLQNRHQTVFPLAGNLGRRAPGEQGAVAAFAAMASLAAGDDAAGERVEGWLRSTGANADALATFAAARDAPPRLHEALDAVSGPELSGFALIAALVAAGRAPDPAARLFAEYVAARLGVPRAAVRAAERRFSA